MAENAYEYKGLLASSWDFLRGETSNFPDTAFYKRAIVKNRGTTLIVGCGTGRLLIDYLQEGLTVEGVDVSPEMIDICNHKAKSMGIDVVLYIQPMEDLNIQKEYRTIIVPSSSFQLVTNLDDAKKTLSNFRRLLAPDGQLIMSFWQILRKGSTDWSDWWKVVEKEGFQGNKTIIRWEQSMYDANTQLRHTRNKFELLQNGEIIDIEEHERSPEMRNYGVQEIIEMVQQTGYSQIDAVSGFTDQPAKENDEVFCISAHS